MRLSRFLPGVLAAVLSVALVGGAPARAVAPVGDPRAAMVTGACSGGSGRVSLTVHPTGDGRYRVELTARGMVEGSRWTGHLFTLADTEAGDKDFRRVAVDGGWTVTARFPAAADLRENVFFGEAQRRGDRANSCIVVTQLSPAVGASACNRQRPQVSLVVRERDGSTVVDSYIFDTRQDSRWHLTLTAAGAASRQVVKFDDRAKRRGVVRSRVVLNGVDEPRLRLVASNNDQGRCFIRFDPQNVTTDAPLTLQGFRKLSDRRG